MFWINCFQQSPGTRLEISFPLKVGRSYGSVVLRLYRRVLSITLSWIMEFPKTELLSCSTDGTMGKKSK